jgi:predicted metal-dependent hydrolase
VQITLDNHTFTLIHRTNKKIKRVSVVIENQNEIILKTPLKFKSHLIKEIVYGYKDWILRSIHKVPKKEALDFDTNTLIPYLGEKYPVRLIDDEKVKNVYFIFQEDHFEIHYSKEKQTYEDFMAGLKTFYKYKAQKVIDPIFDEWCFRTKLYPNNISYRYNKTRWGSCSFQNNISINYRLLQFEKSAIEYVVLHELCHIKEKNHTDRFWNLVSSFMGDYKQKEKLLRFKLL